MSLADLRARALARNAERSFSYTICLNDQLRTKIDKATVALADLHQQRQRQALMDQSDTDPRRGRSLGDPKPRKTGLDTQIEEAENALQALEDSVPDDQILKINFRAISPDDYQKLQLPYIDPTGRVDLAGFWPALAASCYSSTMAVDGEDLGIGWDELRAGTLNSGDVNLIYAGITDLHMTGAGIPFSRANSGGAAKS